MDQHACLQGEQQQPRTMPCSETWIQPERCKRSQQTWYSFQNSVMMPTEPQAKMCSFLKSLCQLVVTVQAAITCYISQKLKVLSICRFTFNLIIVCEDTHVYTYAMARRQRTEDYFPSSHCSFQRTNSNSPACVTSVFPL